MQWYFWRRYREAPELLALLLMPVFGGFCGLVLGLVAGVILTTIWTVWIKLLKPLSAADSGDSHPAS